MGSSELRKTKTDKKTVSVRKSKLSKTKRLEKELEEEKKKLDEYIKSLKYLQADFENYKKRKEKEIKGLTQFINERMIVNLLEIIDELELAIQSGKETENKDALIKGVDMVLKKMYTTLETEGLTKIKAVGEEFDPEKHEVLMQLETMDYTEGTVIEEIRKGFMLNNKVIRPSLVKIAIK